MIVDLPRRATRPGDAVIAAVDALRRLEAAGTADPVLLGYWPADRSNAFLSLLYGRAWEHGIAPFPLDSLDATEGLASVTGLGATVVLHLHWTGSVLARAADRRAAEEALAAFTARLDRLVDAGVVLAWTIHNSLPHETRFPDLDGRLQQAVVDRATIVHVMAECTAASVAPIFDLPAAKVVQVPLPSFDGAYGDTIEPAAARQELGLDPDAMVYLLLGGIRPYKGLDLLLGAFDRVMEADPARRLVIAGAPLRIPEVERFLDACALHPGILLHAQRVPSDAMQVFLRAADVVVLPYVQTLNSAALLLALTFGLGVVAPDAPTMTEIVGPDVACLFEPGEEASLASAMLAADRLRSVDVRAAARRIADARHHRTIGRQLALVLRERLGLCTEDQA